MRGEVAIVGTHQLATEAEMDDVPEEKMVFDVVKGALADAGITQDDLDTAIVAGNDVLDGRTISNTFTAEAEGGFMKDETKVAHDGMHAALYGVMRILSGLHDVAMVVAYGNHNSITYSRWTNFAMDPFRVRPTGVDGLHLAAMQARRYYEETGATPDDAARLAARTLSAAGDHPLALSRGDVAPEDVAASETAADPLRDLEVGPPGDGAAAVVLADADLADSFDADPAYVLGVGHASDALRPGTDAFWQLRGAGNAAEAAFDRAGIAPGEVDVAEVTDLFAPHQMMLGEALGLVDRGPDLLDDGAAVNPSGGALAGHAYFATGLQRLVETTRQVTGQSPGRQIDDARVGLAHGASGPAHQANAVALVAPEVGG